MNKHRKDFESISEAYLNMPALKAPKLLQESQVAASDDVVTETVEEDAPEDWDPKVQGKHLGPSEPGVDYDERKPEPTEAILGDKSEMVENLIDRLEHRDKFMIADLPEIHGKGFLEIGFEDNASGAGLDIYTLKVIDYRQEE